MAASLGSLVVSLGLDSAEFTRGLTKAERDAQRAMDKIQKDFAETGKAIGLAAVAVGAVVVAMGAQFINAAADLDDLAEKTGASVEELSKLEQQAYISGASMETIEMGLIRLTKALHGSDEEAQGAGKALAALGLKADELKNKDTAEALRIVAGELNKYQDGAGKTALALDLFGKSGAALLPILKDMATEGELNARVTAEQAAQAEELGKAWRRMVNDAKAVGQAFALDMIPKLADLIGQFREGIKIAGGFTDALRLFGLSSITSDNAGAKIRQITKDIEGLRKEREKLDAYSRAIGADRRIDKQIEDLEKQKKFASLLLQQSLGDKDNFDPSFGGSKARLDYEGQKKAGGAVKKVIDEAEKDRKEQIALAGRMIKADAEAMKYFADEIRKLDDAALKDREDQIRQAGKMIAADAQAQVYFRGEIEKFAKEAAEAQKAAADQTVAIWDEAYRNMQRSASDFLYGLMQGEFDNFGKRFKQTIDRMVADWVAAQALMEATSFIGKRLGGGNDFGALTGIIGAAANWIGGTQAPAPVSDLTPRAMGGPVYPGQEYLVGERGPEIFRPRSSGVISPNRDSASGDRAVYITVNTPDADSFRRTKGQLAREISGAFGAMG